MEEIDVIGIDLGTTNSVIAIWDLQSGQPKVLTNREGELLTPSVVTFDPEKNMPMVGESARARMVSHPAQVIYSVKRFIGCTFHDRWVRYDQEHVTYAIEETQQHRVMIRAGNHSFTPSQVSAEVLRKLKNDAEAALGGRRVAKAVITVPAYFNEARRQATREAGEQAGLYIPRIINEPTAAALAFGLGPDPQTVAIYDLGGGTFDISILRIDNGLFRVRATKGDTHLGGDDFDLAIVEWMKKQFKHQHGIELPVQSNSSLRALLRREAERAKIALSSATEVALRLPNLFTVGDHSLSLETTLTRAELEALIQPLINRSLEICDAVLKNAKLGADQIDQVLLVGGQTRTPHVRTALHSRYGWTLNDSVNPDEAVAQGAAVLGARLCGHLKQQVNLWDVIPQSLGIRLADEKMDRVISANTQIPVKVWRKEAFTTYRDGQERIRFEIYQGEQETAKENTLIGDVILNLTTTRRASEHRVSCMFEVDRDGILHVRAEEADTEGNPIEAKFDRIYKATQEELDQSTIDIER